MKQILLIKLEISNWRGQNRVMYPLEEITTIKGKNGSGKTSVMSAWYWLLSGYTDANTPQNHNLFDTTKELTKDTPSASVKAMVRIGDIDWLLEKKVTASFKRDKTSDTWVKSQSDTYTYKIDGIEVSATDFKKWIDTNICPVEMITFCMCGQFFSSLSMEDKKQARMYLERICGEIKLEDMKDRDYSVLKDMFAKGYSIEKIKDSFKSTLKSLYESAEKIPVEIESKNDVISYLMNTNFDAVEDKLAELKNQLEETEKKIRLQNAFTEAEAKSLNLITEKIASKRMELSKGREDHLIAQESLKSDVKRQIREAKEYNDNVTKENAKILRKHTETEELLAFEENYLSTLNDERNRLVKERQAVKDMVFKEDTCPYCGQELPEAMLEESLKKFNEKKEQELASIIRQGVAIRDKMTASENKIAQLKATLDKENVLDKHRNYDNLLKELESMESAEVRFEDTPLFSVLNGQIEELQAQADMIRNKSTVRYDWDDERKKILEEMFDCNKELGKKDVIARYEEDVIALQEKARELGISCAELEGKIALCDAYVEEKARLVSNRINEKLDGCEIQMWERLKNGDLTPACSVQSKDGVKLSTINYSRRLLIEAELQKLFCTAYGIKLPIFYDEANVFDSEHKPTSDGWQVFLLQASDDARLVVE